jgi:hypothetical protein
MAPDHQQLHATSARHSEEDFAVPARSPDNAEPRDEAKARNTELWVGVGRRKHRGMFELTMHRAARTQIN